MSAPAVVVGTHLPPGPRAHLSSDSTRRILRLQNLFLRHAREFLYEAGFVELLPPVIGPVTDPGIRGAKQVDVDFYGHRYKLMTSAFVYKQAALLAYDKIFYVAPNVRMEPLETCSTQRHLAEFHQLDIEMAHTSREQVMDLAEELIATATRAVVAECEPALRDLGRDVDALRAMLAAPFERLAHTDAVTRLVDGGHAQSAAAEIDWEGERILSEGSARPVFLTDYPKGSRVFLEREDSQRPGVLRTFDLLMPEGYGEVISGGERESDYRRLITRMRETGENPAKYGWYLDEVRNGIPPSAGFGLGVQRFTRYLVGADYVWQTTAFPKLPGVVSP
ncbi:asparagine synthetase A [Streptomyces sp. NPDC006655]|uniref:asparagine synthetase A n=1 Tax=Streptomyces sp. NPDC006655 TaxID=3156898 RepID=UPI003456028E